MLDDTLAKSSIKLALNTESLQTKLSTNMPPGTRSEESVKELRLEEGRRRTGHPTGDVCAVNIQHDHIELLRSVLDVGKATGSGDGEPGPRGEGELVLGNPHDGWVYLHNMNIGEGESRVNIVGERAAPQPHHQHLDWGRQVDAQGAHHDPVIC